jgi:hypothetical protein
MPVITQHVTPTEVVTTFFKLLRAGSIPQALQCWSHDGVWHVMGQSKRAGDYSMTSYMAMCAQWYVEYPDYIAEFGDVIGMGELAFFNLRSQHGEAPGEMEGMMLYRVVDGLIAEGWGIPAKYGDRYTF